MIPKTILTFVSVTEAFQRSGQTFLWLKTVPFFVFRLSTLFTLIVYPSFPTKYLRSSGKRSRGVMIRRSRGTLFRRKRRGNDFNERGLSLFRNGWYIGLGRPIRVGSNRNYESWPSTPTAGVGELRTSPPEVHRYLTPNECYLGDRVSSRTVDYPWDTYESLSSVGDVPGPLVP